MTTNPMRAPWMLSYFALLKIILPCWRANFYVTPFTCLGRGPASFKVATTQASPLYPVGQYVVQQPLSADHLYYPHESGFPAPTGRNVVPVSFVTNQQRNGVACGTLTEDSVIMYPNGADFTYPKVPTYITCQHCGAKVLTDVDSQCGASYILSCLVCLVCFPLGILLLTGSSNDYVHTCPSCKQEVGTNSSC